MSSTNCRAIHKVFTAHTQKEGAGFLVNRPFPGRNAEDALTDPFLMLDELGPVNYAKGEFEGAPWHPHRGFDTVMYLKAGEGRHQDSMGNSGVLKAGEVQWMTAGSGIIHDEGREHPGGLLHGFQLWVNLPAKDKLCNPQYQQISAQHFAWNDLLPADPTAHVAVAKMKIIAGEVPGVGVGKIQTKAPVLYLDIIIDSVESDVALFDIPVPDVMETAIVYVYDGEGLVFNGDRDRNGSVVRRRDTTIFIPGSSDDDLLQSTPFPARHQTTSLLRLGCKKGSQTKLLVLCGIPIKEPIARYGPFVMNTDAELKQAMEDYQSGKLATHKAEAVMY